MVAEREDRGGDPHSDSATAAARNRSPSAGDGEATAKPDALGVFRPANDRPMRDSRSELEEVTW